MARSLEKQVIGLLCAVGIMLSAQAATSSRTYAADLVGIDSDELTWVLLGAMLISGMNHELVRYCPTCKAVIIGYVDHVHEEGRRGSDCCADLEERVAELEATTVRNRNRVARHLFTNYDDRAWQSFVDSRRFNGLGQTTEDIPQAIYRGTESLEHPAYQRFFGAAEYNAANLFNNSPGAWTPASLIFHPGGPGNDAGQGDND